MKRTRVLLPLLAALAGGCGTTVHGATGVLGEALGPTGAPAPGSVDGSVPGASSAAVPAGSTGASLPGADGAGTTGGPSSSTTGGPAPLGHDGPGVTATTITIGVLYSQNAAAANAALGAGGVKTADPVASTRILFDDINRHGGVAGRRLLLVTYGVDPQSTQPYAQSAQAVCSYFTEDHKVFALIDGAPFAGRGARTCLNKHGVLYLGGTLLTDDAFVANELDALSLTWSHLYARLPSVLGEQHWFGGWNYATAAPGTLPVRVGVLTVDSPSLAHAVDRVLVPGLRAQGHAPAAAEVIKIAPPGGFTDDGAVVAAIHAAVLRFRSDGVSHVILTDSNASMSLLFQNDAYSQRYFPRLGGSSGNGWQALLTAGSLRAQTLAGAVGMGWSPLLDLPYSGAYGPEANATRRACFDLFARAGTHAQDGNSASGMAAACDIAYLLPRALRGYHGPVDRAAVIRLVGRLGTSYPSAGTLGLRFGPDKRDGVGAYRPWAFQSGCQCFAYVGSRASL